MFTTSNEKVDYVQPTITVAAYDCKQTPSFVEEVRCRRCVSASATKSFAIGVRIHFVVIGH